jgi:succinate-acetate transporter protein
MTTVLLNLHNAGLFPMNSMILGMGICYGGIAQVFAGLLEWKKNNTFGTTAFVSYGFFWLSLVALVLLPKIDPAFKTNDPAMASYLAIWGLFTFGLFLGTFRLSCALQVIFGSLTILFFMLAAGHAFHLGEGFEHVTGLEGVFCGLSAFYGKTVLPLGVVRKS